MIDALKHEKNTRNDVLRRLCRLTTKVAREHFEHLEAADCFCGQSAEGYEFGKSVMTALGMGDYRFSEKVLTFIEEAVAEKLASS